VRLPSAERPQNGGFLPQPEENLCEAGNDWWSNWDLNHRSARLGMRDLRGEIATARSFNAVSSGYSRRLLGTRRVHKASQRKSLLCRRQSAAGAAMPSCRNCSRQDAGRSERREIPTPRGSRPSIAALTISGARNANVSVMLTLRGLQPSRTTPETPKRSDLSAA
jgi:hypothetical protein